MSLSLSLSLLFLYPDVGFRSWIHFDQDVNVGFYTITIKIGIYICVFGTLRKKECLCLCYYILMCVCNPLWLHRLFLGPYDKFSIDFYMVKFQTNFIGWQYIYVRLGWQMMK